MPDTEKVIERLSDLKERLKWQKDIQGYGFYVDFINDAIAMLKEQETELCDRCGRVRLKSKWEGR